LERPLNGCLETLADVPPIQRGKRQPRFALLPVNDKCDRIALLLIDKENNHLAVALIRSVMRASAILMGHPGHLQVERLHNTKIRVRQLLSDPGLYLLAGLIKSQKWD
jgi:hypothetical protein